YGVIHSPLRVKRPNLTGTPAIIKVAQRDVPGAWINVGSTGKFGLNLGAIPVGVALQIELLGPLLVLLIAPPDKILSVRPFLDRRHRSSPKNQSDLRPLQNNLESPGKGPQ